MMVLTAMMGSRHDRLGRSTIPGSCAMKWAAVIHFIRAVRLVVARFLYRYKVAAAANV